MCAAIELIIVAGYAVACMAPRPAQTDRVYAQPRDGLLRLEGDGFVTRDEDFHPRLVVRERVGDDRAWMFGDVERSVS